MLNFREIICEARLFYLLPYIFCVKPPKFFIVQTYQLITAQQTWLRAALIYKLPCRELPLQKPRSVSWPKYSTTVIYCHIHKIILAFNSVHNYGSFLHNQNFKGLKKLLSLQSIYNMKVMQF